MNSAASTIYLKKNWMQGLHYGKRLIYYRPIFWLTKWLWFYNKNRNRNSSMFIPSVQIVWWQGFTSIYEVRFFLYHHLLMSDIHKRIRFVKPMVHWYQWCDWYQQKMMSFQWFCWWICISLKGLRLFSHVTWLGTGQFQWSISTNGSIGTNRKWCHSNGSVGE